MKTDHDSGWSPIWVILNTVATALGALASCVALIVAVIALLKAS